MCTIHKNLNSLNFSREDVIKFVIANYNIYKYAKNKLIEKRKDNTFHLRDKIKKWPVL